MVRKVKYNVAFKLESVKKVLEKHQSIHSVSHREGFSKSLLHKWIVDYQNQGVLGLHPKKNQQYSAGFKLSVINLIKKEHLSLREA